MTLPMALTVARIVLAPVFFALWQAAAAGRAAWLIPVWLAFGMIEVSDLLDGHFARARGQESELGKVLDPFADSLARLTYFICFTGSSLMPLWVLLLLVYRDLGVAKALLRSPQQFQGLLALPGPVGLGDLLAGNLEASDVDALLG